MKVDNQKWLNGLALVAGMILGPYALLQLRGGLFGFDWWHVIYTFFTALVGALTAIGINIVWEKPDFGIFFFQSVSTLAHAVLGTGITAMTLGLLIDDAGPASMLMIAAGVGLFAGVFLSRLFLVARFGPTA